jgi:AcrR family transcriptional regulator
MTTPGAPALPTPLEGDEPDDPRRREVVEVAARLLAEDGPHGLSLRRVAAEAGGSTQLVYTLFGGKQGLANALYREGFTRLADDIREALATAPPAPDPERVVALGRAYLAFARREPAFFAVMFGRAIPDFTPTRSTRTAGRLCTFGQLQAIVGECLEAGTLVGRAPQDIARLCWATAHGLASLEAAGLLGGGDGEPLEGAEGFLDHALRVPVDAHRP